MAERESLVVAVVGAGRVGSALGYRWAGAGHEVRYGVRDPDDDRHAALRGHAEVMTAARAVEGATVVLLAVPGGLVRDVAVELGDVAEAVVIDATNPLGRGPDGPSLLAFPEGSGAQALAAALGSARVVKGFNTCGAETMANAAAYAPPPTMWLAGDDDSALGHAARLALDIGFDPVVAGPLAAAADLEHLALLWVRMAMPLGYGRDFVITRQVPV